MILQSFIFTIIGVALISILIEVVLPSGKMSKFIKAMNSFIVVIMLIMPVINYLNSDFNITDFINNGNVQIDKDFLEATNKEIYLELEKSIEAQVENIGYKNVKIQIDYVLQDVSVSVECVKVDISSVKINPNSFHLDIKKEIVNIIISYLNISESKIIFIE